MNRRMKFWERKKNISTWNMCITAIKEKFIFYLVPRLPNFFNMTFRHATLKGIGLEMSTNLYKMYKIMSLKSEYIHVHVSTVFKHASYVDTFVIIVVDMY